MAKDIASPHYPIDRTEVTTIIQNALRLGLQLSEDHKDVLPDECKWDHWRVAYAIGYFRPDGGWYSGPNRSRMFLDGRAVELRKVRYSESGEFQELLVDTDGDTEWIGRCTDCCAGTHCPNIFIHEGCFHYLRAWLSPALPPRLSFASIPQMSFEGELYEILNSQVELREF